MVGSNHCDEETPLLFSSRFDDNDGTRASRTQTKSPRQPKVIRIWRHRLRDAEYRSKVFKTVAVCLCKFTVGLATGQLGPALLDLQIITQTTVQEASTFLTAASAGNILGSAVSGLIYDHLSKDLLLIISQLFMGLMLLVIPFCFPYWLMVTSCCLLSTFRMSTSTAANVEIFRLWDKQATTISQVLQFCFSFGAVISPLITEPFLVPRNDTFAIDHSNCSSNSTMGLQFACDSDFPDASMPKMPKTRVHFAFMITSIVCFVVTAILVAEYVSRRFGKAKRENGKPKPGADGQKAAPAEEGGGERDNQSSRTQQNSSSSALDLPLVPYIGVLVWISLFFSMNVPNQHSANSYLETYAVLGMNWSKSEGAFLSSVYWVSNAVTRLACAFVANYVNSLHILIISFLVLVPSHLLFVFMSLYQMDVGVWVSTVLYAAALSPMFASFIAWMDSSLIPLTGKVNSCIGLSSHAGSMLFISVLGYLIENYGAIWLAYIMLVEATLNCLLFVSLFLFARLYLQPKYSARRDFVITYSALRDGSESTTLLK